MKKDEIERASSIKNENEKIYLDDFKEKIRKEIIGQTPAMEMGYELMYRCLYNKANILILGETGTGKELVAKALHSYGSRRKKPFVATNCAMIPSELMYSELFGYRKGAFTGACEDRMGMFQVADKGTIFLDEISDMPVDAQAGLLRFVEDGKIRRLGSENDIKVDVRIITASNKDLRSNENFRIDLFYRLNTMPILIPNLRYRIHDIPLLIAHFISELNSEHKAKVTGVTLGFLNFVVQAVKQNAFAGNIRDLKNFIECCFLNRTNDNILQPWDGLQYLYGLNYVPEHWEERKKLIDEFKKEKVPLKDEGYYWVEKVKRYYSLSELSTYATMLRGDIKRFLERDVDFSQILRIKTKEITLDLFNLPYKQFKEESEKEWIKSALRKNKGNKRKTAEEMVISESALYRKLKKYRKSHKKSLILH